MRQIRMCKDLKHLIYARFNTGPVGKVRQRPAAPPPLVFALLCLESSITHKSAKMQCAFPPGPTPLLFMPTPREHRPHH